MPEQPYIPPDRPWRKENVFPVMSYKPSIDAFGIYGIVNNNNSKLYVGSAVNFLNRWRVHSHQLSKQKHDNVFLQRAFLKNPDAFEYIVIEQLKDKSSLADREQFWMDFYRSYDDTLGYNLRPRSNSNLGKKFGPEMRMKISLSQKGKPSRRKGCRLSQEQKDRIREKRKGAWLAGENHPMWGRKHKSESLDKMKLSKRGQGIRTVIQMDMNGNEIARFPSLIAAQAYMRHPHSMFIGGVARGEKKSAYGFKWQYAPS